MSLFRFAAFCRITRAYGLHHQQSLSHRTAIASLIMIVCSNLLRFQTGLDSEERSGAAGHTPGSQSPEGSLGCPMVALNRHISSIFKDFPSMVFFMVFIASSKSENIDTMKGELMTAWYQPH
jgi:hypothetical protein